ncbi:hypothetical protein FACS1894159_11760 [Bacteroidia bacterium]|nr:hypothetical protein FACS1894159_11760 [Bacteroidia bacterium]
MKTEHAPAIVAGADFSLIVTALCDDAGEPDTSSLPATSPQELPAQWLEDLTDFDLTLQLSSTGGGDVVVAATEPGEGMLPLQRIDSSHLALNVPRALTEGMREGELVLTVLLRHRPTDSLQKAERKLQRIIRVKEVRL